MFINEIIAGYFRTKAEENQELAVRNMAFYSPESAGYAFAKSLMAYGKLLEEIGKAFYDPGKEK